MDDYFMDQVIDSFCHDDWWDGGNSFHRDPNYHHHRVMFNLVHETEKAWLLGSRQGEFWCPKSLLRDVDIKKGKITGLLWNGFEPKFKKPEKPIDVFDAFAGIDKEEAKAEKTREKTQKKIDKRLKKEEKKKLAMASTPTGKNDAFFLKWLGVY